MPALYMSRSFGEDRRKRTAANTSCSGTIQTEARRQ